MHAPNPFQIELGDASCWCDSTCERCPLFGQCDVGQAVAHRLTRMELEDGPALAVEVTRDLNRALLQLQDMCEAEGIDPETCEPPATPAVVKLAETLGADLVRAAVAVTRAATGAGRLDQVSSSRLVGDATLMAVKTARVAWALNTDPPVEPAATTDPILLLIEHTSAQLRRDARRLVPFVPMLLTSQLAAAHAALIELVTPWIAMVGGPARAELQARIVAGCAPSPFCQRRFAQAA
jgi:hypothetical protein